MRYAELFAKTKRDAPAEITDPTLRLAYRAGLIRPVEHNEFIYLPLAANVIAQMMAMLRAELLELDAQELRGVPHVSLAPLAAAEIQSYKHLPVRVYWHSSGMSRLHLAALEAEADAAQETVRALETIAREFFEYAGVEPHVAQDVNGGRVWYTDTPQLDLDVFTAGDYAATRAAASPFKPAAPQEEPLPVQEVETPHCDTIESLARLLNVPTSRTAKAIFYASGDRIIFAVIRGDLHLDEEKVKRALGLDTLRWATDEEIVRVGAVPGYASPIGVRGATIIADDSIVNSPNLVAGANKSGYHLLNSNVPRDFKPDVVADIALARVGDPSPDGKGPLALTRGARLGAISAPYALDASFLDKNGKAQKQIAVTLELDLGTTLLAHIGAHHDDKGILWTRAIAPYDAYVIALNADKPEVAPILSQVNDALLEVGLEPMLDDRNESAGVKFNDADLLGLPLRITVGPKTVAQGSVELKRRSEADTRLIEVGNLAQELNRMIDEAIEDHATT